MLKRHAFQPKHQKKIIFVVTNYDNSLPTLYKNQTPY